MRKKKRTKKLYQKQSTIGGKRRVFYGRTLGEIKEKINKAKADHNNGLNIDDNPCFSHFAKMWLDSKSSTGESNKQNSKGIYKNHLAVLADIEVKKLNMVHLQTILNDMAANEDKKYSKKSMSNVKAAAVAIAELAVDSSYLNRNPFKKAKVPKSLKEDKPRQPLTDVQQDAITTYTAHRMAIPALIMYYCGLRRGEMLALVWGDFDFKANTISITKSISFEVKTGKPIGKKPKSRASIRTVRIPSCFVPQLKAARATAKSTIVCPAKRTSGYMSLQAYQRAWESYMQYLNACSEIEDSSGKLKMVGFTPFTAHQLRHTYATMLFTAGVDVLTARYLLGHEDIETTLKIYTHLTDEKRDKSITALNDYFAGKSKNPNASQ